MISLKTHNEWRAWLAAWEITWAVIAQHMLSFPNGVPRYTELVFKLRR